jgi:hypothetical protein
MLQIPLQAIPNQELTVVLDGVLYDLTIKETNGCMVMDVTRGGVVIIVQGARCVAGAAVLPYVSLEGQFGNFAFVTSNGDLPYYDQFGTTQTLVFATEAEIGAIRNGES